MRFSKYLKNLLNILNNIRIFVSRPMKNIKWYVTNSSEGATTDNKGSARMSYI